MPAAIAAIIVPALGQLVAVCLGIGLIFVMGVVSCNLLVPFVNSCGDPLTNWVTIPVVNEVILWGQTASVAIAIVIRIVLGIKEGVFADGGPRRVSLGEYVFKSLCSVVLVGLMPILCSVVMQFGASMFRDVIAGTGGSQNLMDGIEINCTWSILFEFLSAENSIDLIVNSLVVNIIVLVALGLTVACVYQLFKRQFQMLIVGVVGPWVGIKAATNSDSGQYWDYLVSLFGMCVVQWVQYLFLMISLSMLSEFLGAGHELFQIGMRDDGARYLTAFVMLACFGATLSAQSLLERYTFVGGGGGAGNMMLGMVLRGGVGGASRMGNSLGRAAGSSIVPKK